MRILHGSSGIRRSLAMSTATALASFGLAVLPATPAHALPIGCTGTETPGPDNIFCPLLLAGQTIKSGAGQDTITIGGDADGTIDAGGDADTVHIVGNINGQIDLGSGNDVFTAAGSTSALAPGPTVHDAGPAVHGGDGNDIFDMGAWNSGTVYGEGGDDAFDAYSITRLPTAPPSALGGDGNDTFGRRTFFPMAAAAYGDQSAIQGQLGNDIIRGGICILSVVEGNDGNDSISFIDSNGCILRGGDGNDKLHVGAEATGEVNGGPGNDMCTEDLPFFGTEEACEPDTPAPSHAPRNGSQQDPASGSITRA